MLRRVIISLLAVSINYINWGVLAQSRITYVPPAQKKQQVRHESQSATRGSCRKDLRDVVTLIVPQDHLGWTTKDRPILFFHVSRKIENRALFTIAEVQGRSALVETPINLSQTGIQQFQLPQKTRLKSNQEYLWTITIICNPRYLSESLEIQTKFLKVSSPSQFSSQLASAKSDREKSELSARAGFWYDTLFYLSKTPLGIHQPDFQNLLEQINLSQIDSN